MKRSSVIIFFNGCSPLPREISRVRIKFEIGIRVLEAEVIEFEIVFQSSLSLSFPLSLLSSDLSIIYYFRESLFVFQSLERFFSLSIERVSLNRVIISMEEFPFSFVLKYISAFHLSSFPSYSLSSSFFLQFFRRSNYVSRFFEDREGRKSWRERERGEKKFNFSRRKMLFFCYRS